MKNLSCVLLAFFICYNLVAQNDESVKNLSTNSFGISISDKPKMSNFGLYVDGGTILYLNIASVNFEGHLYHSESNRVHLYGRLGFGGMVTPKVFDSRDKSIGGLVALTILVGKNKHHFETNIGAFLGTGNEWWGSKNTFNKYPVLDVGYRYQKPDNGIIVRVKIGTLGLGLGLGYAF